ncbi:MAG: trypsin-like peptidase domain-containing protein [Gracilimonas sp.]|uniref:S1C family serine protease n=1 Tax=Gracilimonas sp. TaxID=1974203 RepID=UPI003752C39A|nr:trypsin-like peptidase domain-containing protein [Gracilimonas sp.]
MVRFVTILWVTLMFTGCSFEQDSSQEKPSPIASVGAISSTKAHADKDIKTEAENQLTTIDDSRRNAITNAVDKAGPAVVSITVTELQRGYTREFDSFFFRYFDVPIQREVQSVGSGFIISEDGLVVTNEHVASKNSKTIMVALSDGNTYDAELLGSDELADLSLLKIKNQSQNYPHVEFANSDDIMVGEWSIAMGNPFGLFADGQPSVTVGVVSAKERDFRPDPQDPRVYIEMIQTDAAINRGNSGGPLINSNGEVMGINTFIFTGGTGSGFVGLGFAIPSNRVQKIINQLKESGTVSLDYDPGMKFVPVTRQLIMQYPNIPRVLGLFVTEVNKSGPAYEGGIMPGDVIVQIGEERVTSEMHAWALMREYEEGEKMELHLVRENRKYKTSMNLRKRVQGR